MSRRARERTPIAEELPRELYVEVTNRCNSRCQTCVRTWRQLEPLRDLRMAEFQALVDQFPALERVVLHGIGEPLLNAELPEMIRYLKDTQPRASVLFNSNAALLDEQWQRTLIDVGLDEYRVSIDAANAIDYEAIRGIDAFEAVVANVRAMARRAQQAGRPRLSFWLTAMRENLDQLPALVDLAADVGVPEVYVQRLVLTRSGMATDEHTLYGRLHAQQEAALAEAARRAASHKLAFRASGLSTPRTSLRGGKHGAQPQETPDERPWADCYRMWSLTYVTANGNVLPCCISPFATKDYEALILGNVFEMPFREIWKGERYVARRAALYTAHPLHPCESCGTCWSL
jgi:MoaA/NifB/PqqE/SkfB family radical SAM enzyme